MRNELRENDVFCTTQMLLLSFNNTITNNRMLHFLSMRSLCYATYLKDKSAQPGDQLFILVAQRQLLVASGDRAPLEHSLENKFFF